MSARRTDPKALMDGILAGERVSLARAITLIESTRADHRALAQQLTASLLPYAGKAIRLGLSGAPGVGKSTFTEAFGSFLTGRGHKVAVLAIDPSSARTGGSILGDKTRMELLARDPNAFIRPSPSSGTLGGVARRTREAMLLVEAAGYDVVLIETVGVGQSETAVADMVDMFLLLQSPGGGDELQGIKRGIMELADYVIVNKADGDFLPAAKRAALEYRTALHLMRPKSPNWSPRVELVSAIKNDGMDRVWAAVEEYRAALTPTGELEQTRAHQSLAWMWNEIREGLISAFKETPAVRLRLPSLEEEVESGRITPSLAAQELLKLMIGR